MKVTKASHYLFEQLDIPAFFVDDYFSCLSGDAVKLYLFLQRASLRGEQLDDQSYLVRCQLKGEALKLAWQSLVELGLIKDDAGQIVLADLRDLHQSQLERQAEVHAEKKGQYDVLRGQLKAVIDSIAKTFFSGILNRGWVDLIDKMKFQYQFEDGVIYALIQDCANRNKLVVSYAASIAEAWHLRGIVSFADLDAFLNENAALRRMAKKVAKALGRQVIEADLKAVKIWMDDWGYDEAVIQLALDKLGGAARPQLNYVHRILEKWHLAGLQTMADILAAESRPKQTNHHPVRRSDRAKRAYEERTYTQADFDALLVNIESLED